MFLCFICLGHCRGLRFSGVDGFGSFAAAPRDPPFDFPIPRRQRIERFYDKTVITSDRVVQYIEDGDIAYVYEDPNLIILQMKSDLKTLS
ncbi:hypothetical protein ELG77_36140 [Rhizobium leguminosarum]|uniref:hypothetical protein n=1 Tax=Rhizobium leguminosarum TaxID=384 RepID=UPI0010305A28|nr:hypothetical protein [Rhizobium leguminosarum]TBF25782.1 hypothetical protein ELG92_33770 [Rhizobium leguminosarum]TBG28463.1 hypothetical protein ELG77_36140 [Rhizobium leguminosarum]